MDFVIDPVCFSLVHILYYFADVFIGTLTVVLNKLNEVALFEKSANPIFFICVFQDAVTLKDSVFELTDIKVAVFEHFFSHTVELSVHIIASLDDSQLKFILLAVCVWIVPSLTSSKNKLKAQSINKPIFFKAYDYFVAIFLAFDIVHLLKIIIKGPSMSSSN